MQEVLSDCRSRKAITVLINGESGTGKGLRSRLPTAHVQTMPLSRDIAGIRSSWVRTFVTRARRLHRSQYPTGRRLSSPRRHAVLVDRRYACLRGKLLRVLQDGEFFGLAE